MMVLRAADQAYWKAVPPNTAWATLLAAAGHQQGLKVAIHVLGDVDDDRSPVAVVVRYPPNYVLARHSHASDRLELVVSGSVEVNDYWLGPGDIWTSPADQFYGPHMIGPDGCTTMELATVAGARRITFDSDGTSMSVDFSDSASLAVASEVLR